MDELKAKVVVEIRRNGKLIRRRQLDDISMIERQGNSDFREMTARVFGDEMTMQIFGPPPRKGIEKK